MENQIPLMPKIRGKIIMAATWKITVRKKEIIAEVSPSFKAVKKLEAKIAKPIKIKDKAKILNPETVISKSALS